MVSTRLSLWLEFPLAIAMISLSLSTVDAKFLLQKSCGKETKDELPINSKIWVKTGDEEAVVKTTLEKIHFIPKSYYLIRKNGETMIIEGPVPSRNRKAYSYVSLIRMESGEVMVSCRSSKSKAKKELDEAELPSQPFSNVPQESTTTSISDLSNPVGRSLPLDPKGNGSSVVSTSRPITTIENKLVENTTAISIILQKQTTAESTLIINPQQHTTPRAGMASEPNFPQNTTLTSPPSKPTVVGSATTVSEALITTKDSRGEDKTSGGITVLASSSPKTSTPKLAISTPQVENSTGTMESHSTTTDTVTTPTSSSMNQSTTPQIIPTTVPMEGNSSETKAEDLNGKPWNLKDHVLYIAIGTTLLFVMTLIIMTICIVQRMRKSRVRRLPDNNEDFFIPSAYDNALLRNSTGGGHSNDVRMMYSEVDPDDFAPTELEERVLRTITMDTKEPERPKCLANFPSEENIGPL